MESIQLNFINRSNDTNNSEILIFQQNVAPGYDEIAVAWMVIKNCGQLDNHPFTYPMSVSVGASDSYGNETPHFPAIPGEAFEMILDHSGDVLVRSNTPAASQKEIEVKNNLQKGAIDVNCYRGGKRCATAKSIAPAQKAVFEFEPKLFIGVVSQMEEGEVINSAIISQINTEISLLGITSADIVMTGGGAGPSATPFEFTLENINK